ncbi:MAG: hypothetical protein HOD11_10665 [Candidatus Marinimicrobia bacterium]|nr:hypothetical protein [Candidatus Neomarinimicrobiota bacterium]
MPRMVATDRLMFFLLIQTNLFHSHDLTRIDLSNTMIRPPRILGLS